MYKSTATISVMLLGTYSTYVSLGNSTAGMCYSLLVYVRCKYGTSLDYKYTVGIDNADKDYKNYPYYPYSLLYKWYEKNKP